MDEKELQLLLATNFSDEEIEQDLKALEENTGIVDSPSSNDFNFDEFEYGESATPFVFPTKELIIFDQGEDNRTKTACTMYSPRLANNGQNIVERKQLGLGIYPQKDPKFDWLDYRKYGNMFVGGAIQDALKYLIKVGAITGRSVCNNEQAIDIALSQGKPVVTGSKYGDWGTVFRTKKYSESKKFQGHIFAIVAKVGDNYVCLHGYKTCPYFTLHKSQLPLLYSKNAIMDKSDVDKLNWMKARNKAISIAPLNSELFNLTEDKKLQGMLAELNPYLKKIFNFK